MANSLKSIKVPLYRLLGRLIRDDGQFLKIKYRLKVGKKLNLVHPKGYNEKLQWLKIHDHRELYSTMVDKYAAKEYVAGIIGNEYIIPTLGVWDCFDDINFDMLPNQFVLKCTHDSGGLVICRDKKNLNLEEARIKINRSLKMNFYLEGREYPYKNVHPRIIAEEFMVDESEKELKDYKFFCFNGQPRFLFVAKGRLEHDTRFNFYDMDWNLLPFERGYPNTDSNTIIPKPKGFEEMVELSKKLSVGIPHVRVDLYDINGRIYFGELTLYPGSGFEAFHPDEWDEKVGDMLSLDGII